MSDLETVISLSTAIAALRQQVRELEGQLLKRKMMLTDMEVRLKSHIVEAPEQLATIADLPPLTPLQEKIAAALRAGDSGEQVDPTAVLGQLVLQSNARAEETVTGLIRRLFEAQPRTVFTAAQIAGFIGLPKTQEGTVRQALRRLHEGQFLVKERDGMYRRNPVAPAGAGFPSASLATAHAFAGKK